MCYYICSGYYSDYAEYLCNVTANCGYRIETLLLNGATKMLTILFKFDLISLHAFNSMVDSVLMLSTSFQFHSVHLHIIDKFNVYNC